MSYDIYLQCPTCKDGGPDLPDPTYNLTAIFDRALTGEDLPNPDISETAVVLFNTETDRPRGLRLLTGSTGAATIKWLEKALVNMTDPKNSEVFSALEPSNEWGTLSGAVRVIEQLISAAGEHPTHIWRVH
ncbi:hypothetical protein LCGC14_1123570 [marine sediment metagenome]|uniref:Uncharacterized protein n=1 Tax=marine sediment metagenome TaxID=412755 RepID=A0A0F9M3B9_9ZZZZ